MIIVSNKNETEDIFWNLEYKLDDCSKNDIVFPGPSSFMDRLQ